MVLVEVEANNSKKGCATFSGIPELITDAGKNGLIYRGFVPKVFGPSGKLLSINLVFEEDIEPVEYKYEVIFADNNPSSVAVFNIGVDDDYLGFYPVSYGPSGKMLKLGLVKKAWWHKEQFL